MCWLVLSGLSQVSEHRHLLGFFYKVRMLFLKFPNYEWLPRNSTFGSWFSWYTLCCCFQVGSDKIFILVIQKICFRCLLKRSNFFSYSYCILIAYISNDKRGRVIIYIYITERHASHSQFVHSYYQSSPQLSKSFFQSIHNISLPYHHNPLLNCGH